ncbi:MAG: site-2 protease family protein [Anaerolineae bacterium]
MDTRSLIAGALGILLALDVHECFHAWVADQLGDPTARYMGRISLNPIVHLDPLGTMMMLFAAFSGRGIGWGKPVPVNPRNLRYGPRVGMGIVSFAGPFANLVTASLTALPLRLRLSLPGSLSFLLMQVMFINIGLAIFNLIPLPPLDGYGVLQGILASIRGPTSYRLSRSLTVLEQQGPFLLLLLILSSQFLGLNLLWRFMDPVVMFFARLMLGV